MKVSRVTLASLAVGMTALIGAAVGVAVDAAPSATGSVLVPVVPERVLDTREPGQQFDRLGPGETATLSFASVVPTDAEAVDLNVTIVGGSSPSYLQVFPVGAVQPVTSVVNWVDGAADANGVAVKLGTGRAIKVFNSAGSVDVVVDLMGYYVPETVSGEAGPQGPQGPQGIPGVADVETIESSGAMSSGAPLTVQAICPTGKVVLSGGFALDTDVNELINALESRPDDGAAGWRVTATSAVDQLLTVYAVCAAVAET